MNVYLESPDRALRERAWRLAWERRGRDAGALDALFDEMLALRSAIAREAGFDSYTDYRFRQLGRFDYTPQDCLDFHAAIEKEVVPLASRLLELRRGALGLEKLRPWDLEVDPFAGQPLKPFETADQLASGVENMVARVDARLAPFFQVMRRRGWMDLMSRTGKRAGGFCSALHCSQGSFILMNASGRADDVYTLLHESGHAFHNFLSSRAQPLFFARETPIEFAETASMSMELLGSAHLDVFFSPRDAAQVLLGQLEKIVLFLPYMSTIDLFQHWVYANPQASHAERHAKYLELHRRFLPGVDYSGLDAVRQAIWHQKLHIFCVPFYYVEYGMAQLGALQVWKNSLADPQEATRAYLEALALGGTRTLPELFSAAGARFSFDARTLGSLMALCREKIEALSAHLAADKVKGKL